MCSVLFFLPWEGCTLGGTTDSESSITMTPAPTAEEVNFIMQVQANILQTFVKIQKVDVKWGNNSFAWV